MEIPGHRRPTREPPRPILVLLRPGLLDEDVPVSRRKSDEPRRTGIKCEYRVGELVSELDRAGTVALAADGDVDRATRVGDLPLGLRVDKGPVDAAGELAAVDSSNLRN